MKKRKRFGYTKNFKNLELSFSLVNQEKGILNEDWTKHTGYFINTSDIEDIIVTRERPFVKKFNAVSRLESKTVTIEIVELNFKAAFDLAKTNNGSWIRIHGLCNPINPEPGASIEEYFEVKDIRITEN